MFLFTVATVLVIHCFSLYSAKVILHNERLDPSRPEDRLGDEIKPQALEIIQYLGEQALQIKKTGEMLHRDSWDTEIKLSQLYEELTMMHANIRVQFKPKCVVCRLAIEILQEFMKHGVSQADIGRMVTKLCHLFHIEKPDVCEGAVNQYKEEVLYVLSHLSSRTASCDYICGVLLGTSCNGEPGPKPEWNVTFPDIPKPPVTPLKPPNPGSPKLKVLHLSDLHVDFLYKPGSNAECGKPLCCHDGEAKGEPAGKWGDYRKCDIPTWTVEHLFQNLSRTTQFDYILWTGDLPSHMIWNQSRAEHLQNMEYLTGLFLKYFPTTPVYSAVGNHESVPVNSFPPPAMAQSNHSVSWLYEGLYRSWRNWLPSDTEDTILRGGFYTTLVRPGFRIVSLNNNYCNTGNWWLFLNSTDPVNELSWLVSVLQQAEANREKVHVIGHIPPGAPECLRTWSWNYYRIVNRYEGVIAGQFFGHKHNDLLEIFYDAKDFQRPISVAYSGPSVTTYSNLNPGYRVYEIDGFYPNSSWMVLDHETFVMNLTDSNAKDRPVWYKEYSAKSAYNMTSLTPDSWNVVSTRLLNEDNLFQKYLKFYYKSSDVAPSCDAKCRQKMVCEVRSGLSHDLRPCPHLFQNSEESEEEVAASYFRWMGEKKIC